MQHADYFDVFLKDTVNLSQFKLDLLSDRVDAIYKALKDDDEIGSLILGKSPQGSWAHRTIISPVGTNEFDADFMLLMEENPDWADSPKTYIEKVYSALHRHSVYKDMPYSRKCRCVRLVYANSMHVDIVPYLTLSNGRQVIVNRDEDEWEDTDPEGFTAWMREKDTLANGNLRKVIRLMKYLRSQELVHRDTVDHPHHAARRAGDHDPEDHRSGLLQQRADGTAAHREGSRRLAAGPSGEAVDLGSVRVGSHLRPPVGPEHVLLLPGPHPRPRRRDRGRLRGDRQGHERAAVAGDLRRRIQGTDHFLEQREVPHSPGGRDDSGAVGPGRVTKRRPVAGSTDWQKQTLAELRAIATGQPDDVRITGQPVRTPDGIVVLRVRLHTGELRTGPNGLELHNWEEFVVGVGRSPFAPPHVEVEHTRFAGYPHVLQGRRLCIYLDPSREWNPAAGAGSFLNRLWDWPADAAAGRFDASTAMYHAVGGVLHHADGTPTIVIRESGPAGNLQRAYLISRTAHRMDLTYTAPDNAAAQLPVITLATDLPFGASSTLATLLAFLDDPYLDRPQGRTLRVAPQSPGLLTALAASATRNLPDSPQYFVLAVPHPAGGPPQLLAGRLPPVTADALRHLVAAHGVALNINPASVNPNIPIEWCAMSDERPEVTTRRDDNRPVNSFQGRTIQIWGCGGLGSWIAEFIARAGAAHITVCDPGTITGGLLARQDYVEEDVGDFKASALARRLRAINDHLAVEAVDGALPPDLAGAIAAADLVIDATVSVAIGQCLDVLAATPGRKAVLAQVATDARSGTLGVLSVSAPTSALTLTQIDQKAGAVVTADATLELYRPLWEEPLLGQELIPTRGCSVPTFHGSAADLAAIAASLVTLLGMHLATPTAGTHLVALPHADAGPRHHFVPVEDPNQ